MDILHSILVAVHIVSAAAIVGGWFAHFRNPTVTTSQWRRSVGMIVSGAALFGFAMSGEPNHRVLGVKFLNGGLLVRAAPIGAPPSHPREVLPTGPSHPVAPPVQSHTPCPRPCR